MTDIFDKMADTWPSEIVARTSTPVFSGGLLTPKYMANLDSLGEGPESLKVGKKVVYPKRPLVKWMRGRSKK
jgi:hypothetical protein